jgi:hypothetical protein
MHSWVGEGRNLSLGLFCETSNVATGANVQAPSHLCWERAAYQIAAFCKLFTEMPVDCAVSGYKCAERSVQLIHFSLFWPNVQFAPDSCGSNSMFFAVIHYVVVRL